mmetsp:Transcript_58892/g.140275  ORF Transcript_58892/g.140275 Transcript_58892/m.140275 type:complete len:278 (-) Transcript_58892:72-905(-)
MPVEQRFKHLRFLQLSVLVHIQACEGRLVVLIDLLQVLFFADGELLLELLVDLARVTLDVCHLHRLGGRQLGSGFQERPDKLHVVGEENNALVVGQAAAAVLVMVREGLLDHWGQLLVDSCLRLLLHLLELHAHLHHCGHGVLRLLDLLLHLHRHRPHILHITPEDVLGDLEVVLEVRCTTKPGNELFVADLAVLVSIRLLQHLADITSRDFAAQPSEDLLQLFLGDVAALVFVPSLEGLQHLRLLVFPSGRACDRDFAQVLPVRVELGRATSHVGR